MEATSLHPIDSELVSIFVSAISEKSLPDQDVLSADPWSARVVLTARRGYERALAGDEAGTFPITYGLAQLSAQRYPTFFQQGLSLTAWEARFDRGAGIMMRPPSYLFKQAGFDIDAARRMPIRLDFNLSMMGGAYVPAELVPQFQERLMSHLEQIVRRLVDAELDGVAVMGLMLEAVRYAYDHKLGLYEAEDVLVPGEPASIPPGGNIIYAHRKQIEPELRKRLELAARSPKKPSIFDRIRGKV